MDRGISRCSVCHQAGDVLCLDCQRYMRLYHNHQDDEISGLDGCVIAWHYDKIIRHVIHQLKYSKGRKIAGFVGTKIARLILTTLLGDRIHTAFGSTLVTCVPTHWFKRYCTRGYNQAELLARNIADHLNLPFEHLLCKTRRTNSQVRVSRSRRLTNVAHSFGVTRQYREPELIIIVDDVITTGATMSECARMLRDQYPRAQIWGVCISRNR